jgi:hypothetical protein
MCSFSRREKVARSEGRGKKSDLPRKIQYDLTALSLIRPSGTFSRWEKEA